MTALKTTIPQPVNLSRLIIFGLLILSPLGLYALPLIWPAHIGSGYAAVSLGLTVIMIYIWQRRALSPRGCLYLGIWLYIALLPMPALTSNDNLRYLWDGAVLTAGFDPYITAPNDAAVSALRSLWPTPEEHAEYVTLYPPGALLLFGASSLFGPVYGLWVWKLLASIAGTMALICGYSLLRRRGQLQHMPLLALNPLLLLETGVGAHVDIFCVLGILGALLCVQIRRPLWAGIIIGLAASIKFIPALIAGPLIFYLAPKQALKLFIGAALTWYIIYLGAFHMGYQPLGLLPEFFSKWRGGAPFYPGLETLQKSLSLEAAEFAGLMAALAILCFTLSAYLARQGHIIIAMALTLSVPLLLSPVLFPWYLMSLTPLLMLRPCAALLLPISLMPLFYIVLDKWLTRSLWEVPAWFAPLLAAAVLGGLAFDLRRAGRPSSWRLSKREAL